MSDVNHVIAICRMQKWRALFGKEPRHMIKLQLLGLVPCSKEKEPVVVLTDAAREVLIPAINDTGDWVVKVSSVGPFRFLVTM